MGPVPQPDEDRDHPSHNENEIEDAEHPDVMINVDESDSDEDDDDDNDGPVYEGYMGYQALAQDGGAAGQSSDSEEEYQYEEQLVLHGDPVVDSNQGAEDVECNIPEGLINQVRHPNYPNTENLPGYMQVPDLPRPERKDMLWNQERHTDTPLETDHADKILSVMSSIKLPSSNIPDWARTLSDDQWQVQVVSKLVKQRTSLKNNQEIDKQMSRTEHICESTEGTDVQEVNKDEKNSKPDNNL